MALDHPDAWALHARIGELRARLGEYPQANEALETAAALAGPADLPAIEVALGRVHRRRGDLRGAASHLDAALASSELDPSIRTRALVERCVVELQAGALDTAAGTAELALESAERAEDPTGAGMAERLVGLVAQASGDPIAARAAFERSAELAANDRDPTASIAAASGLALAIAAGGSTTRPSPSRKAPSRPVVGSAIVTWKRPSRTTSRTSFTTRVVRPTRWST